MLFGVGDAQRGVKRPESEGCGAGYGCFGEWVAQPAVPEGKGVDCIVYLMQASGFGQECRGLLLDMAATAQAETEDVLGGMALELADRAYVLEIGSIVATGTGDELLADDTIKEAYLGVVD